MCKKTLLFIVLLIPGILLADSIRQEYDLKMGKTIEISLQTGGSVHVRGWDQEKVEVEIMAHSPQIIADILEVSTDNSGMKIALFTEDRKQLNLERISLSVPEKSNIEVETMGGEIILSDLQGNFSGKTMGGRMRFSGLKGTIDMVTMGGNIDVAKSVLDGNVETMGGNIMLNDITGDLDAKTMGGNVIYRNVYDSEGHPRSGGKVVKISTMGGNIELSEAPQGADLKTMGGNIEVDRASVYVNAHTMGGSITIDEIDGWVSAVTMGGNVKVKMTGDVTQKKRDVTISSMGGEIDLTLPENLSCVFDIRLNITRGSGREYEIDSAFELTRETKDWDYSGDNPKKVINAKGKNGDGKHRITIETTNGDIHIRKAK